MNTDKRREREKIILEQAKLLIKANGFENTSIQQIALNCGLAVGTLYNYFPSKNDILISLIMNEVTSIIESSETILKNSACEPQECFGALFKDYSKLFTFFNKELWIKFLAETAVKVDAVNVEGYLWKGFEQLRTQIEKLITIMKNNKIIRDTIDVKVLSTLLFNLFYIHFREYIYSNYSVEQVLESLNSQIAILVLGIKK